MNLGGFQIVARDAAILLRFWVLEVSRSQDVLPGFSGGVFASIALEID